MYALETIGAQKRFRSFDIRCNFVFFRLWRMDFVMNCRYWELNGNSRVGNVFRVCILKRNCLTSHFRTIG